MPTMSTHCSSPRPGQPDFAMLQPCFDIGHVSIGSGWLGEVCEASVLMCLFDANLVEGETASRGGEVILEEKGGTQVMFPCRSANTNCDTRSGLALHRVAALTPCACHASEQLFRAGSISQCQKRQVRLEGTRHLGYQPHPAPPR